MDKIKKRFEEVWAPFNPEPNSKETVEDDTKPDQSEWLDAIHWAKGLIENFEKEEKITTSNFDSHEPEEKFQLITEYADDLICIINNKTLKVEFINHPICHEMLGYERGELINKYALDFIEPAKEKELLEFGRKNRKNGELKGSIRFLKKNGEYIWLEFRGKIFIDIDNQEKTLFILRDITDRKKYLEHFKKQLLDLIDSEIKYKMIIDNVNDLILIVNKNFEFEFLNEKVNKNILGYDNVELLGKQAFEFIHPEDKEKAIDFARRNWKNGEAMDELRVRRKDGTFLKLELKGRLFMGVDGIERILFIGRDISGRKISKSSFL